MDEEYKADLVEKMVDDEQLNRYLYRFRAVNGDETIRNRFFDIIEKSGMWFSNPDGFNDPFDCQILIDENNTKNEIFEYFYKISDGKIDINEIEEKAKYYNDNKKEFSNLLNESLKKEVNNKGVCCFSKSPYNMLQWAHYTGSHKGVCFEFDIKEDPYFFTYPLKVNYEENYPVYNYLRDSEEDLVNKVICTKSKDWEYEKEVRVFKHKHGLHSFKKRALKGVYFGINCTNIQEIISTCEKYGFTHLNYFQARPKHRQYGIEFEEINKNDY